MIISDSKTTKTNITTYSSFKIKESELAFTILSSNLYSNKIAAIIRELSTNAYDSHVQAGNKDPFYLHLPNAIEPYFEIRDFGTGISEEDIFNIYTTFFESTKNESNDLTGCLGLGSKSPFSYTESFQIISYYNGKKYTFIAALKDRLPIITKVLEENTEEKNGLKISFPVMNKDIKNFIYEANEFFRYQEDTPIIYEGDLLATENFLFKGEKTAETDTFVFYKNIKNSSNKCLLKQGHNFYDITKSYTFDELTELRKNVSSDFLLIIKGNIGDYSITPSREDLHYDDRTVKNIKNMLISINNEIQNNQEKYLNIFTKENMLRYINSKHFKNIKVKNISTSYFRDFTVNEGENRLSDASVISFVIKIDDSVKNKIINYFGVRGSHVLKAPKQYVETNTNGDMILQFKYTNTLKNEIVLEINTYNVCKNYIIFHDEVKSADFQFKRKLRGKAKHIMLRKNVRFMVLPNFMKSVFENVKDEINILNENIFKDNKLFDKTPKNLGYFKIIDEKNYEDFINEYPVEEIDKINTTYKNNKYQVKNGKLILRHWRLSSFSNTKIEEEQNVSVLLNAVKNRIPWYIPFEFSHDSNYINEKKIKYELLKKLNMIGKEYKNSKFEDSFFFFNISKEAIKEYGLEYLIKTEEVVFFENKFEELDKYIEKNVVIYHRISKIMAIGCNPSLYKIPFLDGNLFHINYNRVIKKLEKGYYEPHLNFVDNNKAKKVFAVFDILYNILLNEDEKNRYHGVMKKINICISLIDKANNIANLNRMVVNNFYKNADLIDIDSYSNTFLFDEIYKFNAAINYFTDKILKTTLNFRSFDGDDVKALFNKYGKLIIPKKIFLNIIRDLDIILKSNIAKNNEKLGENK